jgi:hypothetical protein
MIDSRRGCVSLFGEKTAQRRDMLLFMSHGLGNVTHAL